MMPSETAELLSHVAEAFPGRFVVTPRMVALWATMLSDLDAEDANRALREHLVESPHPPTIADLRRRVAERRVAAPDIGDVWGEIRRAVARVGRYGHPSWSHPAIAAAVEAIGWVEICDTREDDVPTLRAQLERYAKAYLERLRRNANAGALERHLERAGVLTSGQALSGLLKGGAR